AARRIGSKLGTRASREARDRMVLPQATRTPEPPMPLSLAELQPALHDLFHAAARRLAADTAFCRRQRLLTGPAFAQAVVFSLLDKPASSLEDFADFAAQNLGVSVTPKAFDERFTRRAADFLRALFGGRPGPLLRRPARPAAGAAPLQRRLPARRHP